MKILCIQGSLNPDSHTSILLRAVFDKLEGVKKSYLDLRQIKLDFCDGRKLSDYSESLQLAAKEVAESDAYIIGMPVYCFSVSGVLKNFLDITCGGMKEKPFAVVSASGTEHSFLATAELQKILAFEAHCLSFPRVVFASDNDFQDGMLMNEEIEKRVDRLAREFVAWIKGGGEGDKGKGGAD